LANLKRFLGHRLIGKHTDPDLPAALDVPSHRAPRRLDLTRRQSASIRGLQAVLSETDLVASLGEASISALVLFSELGAFRL
jgi:hypothetical protein